MPNIIIYSTATCLYCKMTKSYLDSKQIPYKSVDVGIDEKAAQEMIGKSGQMSVPVIDMDGQIVVGFNQPAIDALIVIK